MSKIQLVKIAFLVLLIVTLAASAYSQRTVNLDSDAVIEIGLGDFHKPIRLAIDENFNLEGDIFEVTRNIWFYNVSQEKTNFRETFNLDDKRNFYAYKLLDGKDQVLNEESYLEANYIDNGTKLLVTFPDIPILSNGTYHIKEVYKVKYESLNKNLFWYPFNTFPFNRSIMFRDITYTYDLLITVPKSFEPYYNNRNIEYAIQGYYTDSVHYNISDTPDINMEICLTQSRPFIAGENKGMREIKFPTVLMPSWEDDPCKATYPKVKVFFTIGKSKLLKNLFFVFTGFFIILLIVYFWNIKHFVKILGIVISGYIFQQGLLLYYFNERPPTLVLWDFTILPLILIILIHIIPHRKVFNILRNLWMKLVLINRRRQMLFKLEFYRKIPRLVIHQKYKKIVNYGLRAIAILSSGISIITLPWYVSLSITLMLAILEQLLERVIFVYTSIYLQAIPESYKSSDWLGMLFGIPQDKNQNFILGMIFDNEASAKRIFPCIEAWNQKRIVDSHNNIRVSFIIESDSEYSAYIYPSHERKPIKDAAEKFSKGKKDNERHQQLIFQIMFCKPFDYNERSNFKLFKEHYPEGHQYEFGAYVVRNGNIVRVPEMLNIIKKHLKIKERQELTASDPEYEHKKFLTKK